MGCPQLRERLTVAQPMFRDVESSGAFRSLFRNHGTEDDLEKVMRKRVRTGIRLDVWSQHLSMFSMGQ